MTKIYRFLNFDLAWDAEESEKKKVYEPIEEARKLFLTFKNNFSEWVYKSLFPKRDGGMTPLEKEIGKWVSNFTYALDSSFLFPTFHGASSRIPDLAKMKNQLDTNVKRYQVAATKAFKDLEVYIDSHKDLEVTSPVESVDVGGVNVTVINWGRESGGESGEREFHLAMNLLNKRLDQIRKAGFASAVRGAKVTMDFDQKEVETSARYRPSTDEVIMYPLSLASESAGEGTLTHELGHRFYFKALPGQARAHWEEVLESRGTKVTREQIDRFFGAIKRKIDLSDPLSMLHDEEKYRAALPEAKNLTDELVFEELSKVMVKAWDQKTFDLDLYHDRLVDFKEGEVIQIEEVSDYGDTSPIEAFAECFMFWVLKGPRSLKPWTQEFFRRICREGGAKIASRVVQKYLDLQNS